jgi:23S rRNA G2069 N7-methylase RlmK/C1962 C5-methylase RlmI
MPGINIDMYGLYAVIHVYSRHWQYMVMEMAKSLLHLDRRVEGVYTINRVRKTGSAVDIPVISDAESRSKSQCIWGKRAPDHRSIVEENGLLYHVQLDNGAAIGLYMDQRENRKKVVELLKRVKAEEPAGEVSSSSSSSRPKLLNTFSFTGSFSMAAAKNANAITTSVDASELVQLWAKDNFVLNNLDVDEHEFVKKDVFSALVGFFGQKRQFDVILLDPPTISRVKVRHAPNAASAISTYVPSLTSQSKTHFSSLDNYSDLVALASPLVAPGGYMVCFVNTHSLDKDKWRSSISEGLESIIPKMRDHLGQERTNHVRSYLRKRGVKVKYRNSILDRVKDASPSESLIREHYGFEIVDEWCQDKSDFTTIEGDEMGNYLHGIVLKRNRPCKPIPPIELPVIKTEQLHASRGGGTIQGSPTTGKLLKAPPLAKPSAYASTSPSTATTMPRASPPAYMKATPPPAQKRATRMKGPWNDPSPL